MSDKAMLYISTKDFEDLPKMGLDDTGTMTINFRVKGARINDDETMGEDMISYDMEYEIVSIKPGEKTLNQIMHRGAIKVQTQTNPFPG